MVLLKGILVSLFLAVIRAEDALVDVAQGTLKGLKSTTAINQKPFYSFKGIPFAKPRVGKSKFQSPEPDEPWTGVWDATNHRPTCVFFCMIQQAMMGDDDCLYLNVYTPDLNQDAKRAVMVFIHPGGFNAGSGNDDIFGPDFIIEQDVILVTFNHRLGATGFLSTNDANAPGNNGLKDQVVAMRWVQENIKKFGGCPKKVTLIGESSGGASVHYHMLSPMSKGLFSKAVMLSGSVINSWALTYEPAESAFKLGEVLGIKTKDSAELMSKLQEIDTAKLVTASAEVAMTQNSMNGHFHSFIPSVEPNAGQEVFLEDDPWVLMKSGKIADVPVMLGWAKDEATFVVPGILAHEKEANEHFDLFIPNDLNATDPAARQKISESMKKFYFDGKPISKDKAHKLGEMLSDVLFITGCAFTAKIMGMQLSSPVYSYQFTYNGKMGFFKNFFALADGVMHSDDLFYIFYSNAVKNKPPAGSEQEMVTNRFVKLLTNFAKEGNPTAKLDNDIDKQWLPLKEVNNYMIIDQQLSTDINADKERTAFWADIYKDVLGDLFKLFQNIQPS